MTMQTNNPKCIKVLGERPLFLASATSHRRGLQTNSSQKRSELYLALANREVGHSCAE